MSETAKISARRAAVISLERMEKQGRYSNLELDCTIEKYALSGVEKALYTRIFYGVLERMRYIDAIANAVSSRKIETLDSEIRAVIRSGIYQIHFLDKVPVSAACNESVKLAGRRGEGAKRYVNAVLRAASRLDISKLAVTDAVRFSLSDGIADMLAVQYGKEKAREIFASYYRGTDYTALRVNTLKTTAAELAKALGARVSDKVSDVVTVSGGFAPTHDEHFANGEYFVQSEPSALCAKALGAKPNDTVIDACACPGSKTFSIACDMQNKGEIIACDLHKNKLSLVERGAQKLGVSIVKTLEKDGREKVDAFIKYADCVLCDVPCSGLGSIAKKPEIRYKDINEISKLPSVQLAILENCCAYVKRGGTLVYSTCTVNKEENGRVTEEFLLRHKEYKAVEFEIPKGFDTQKDGAGICFLPSADCADGFYIAKFVRENDD